MCELVMLLLLAWIVAPSCGGAGPRSSTRPISAQQGTSSPVSAAAPREAAPITADAQVPGEASLIFVGLVVRPGHVWSGGDVALAVARATGLAEIHRLGTAATGCIDPEIEPGGPVHEGPRDGVTGQVAQQLDCTERGGDDTLFLVHEGDTLIVFERVERFGTTAEVLRVPLTQSGATLRFVRAEQLGSTGYQLPRAQRR